MCSVIHRIPSKFDIATLSLFASYRYILTKYQPGVFMYAFDIFFAMYLGAAERNRKQGFLKL